jgi:hypothetical protein
MVNIEVSSMALSWPILLVRKLLRKFRRRIRTFFKTAELISIVGPIDQIVDLLINQKRSK